MPDRPSRELSEVGDARNSNWRGLGFANSSSPRSRRWSQRVRCATGSIGMETAWSSGASRCGDQGVHVVAVERRRSL